MALSNKEILELKTALMTFDANKHAAFMQQGGAETNNKLRLSAAVAKNSTDDEWIRFINTGELPAVVPVSPKVLETVQGGMVQPPMDDWESYQNWRNSPWLLLVAG